MVKNLNIKNIGPIKEASFDIKKVNIFMGKQSSGKSTIAKILSFCSWVEKDISFHQSFDKFLEGDYFINYLKSFHKMEKYIKENSYIEYYGDAVHIKYSNSKVSIEWLKARFDYKRPKISYIPSERNLVALPEIEHVEFPNNYLRSYLFDWLNIRKNYSLENKIEIIDTNTQYFFSEKDREDNILSNGYSIPLSVASSGLQSVSSLLITVDYLASKIYREKDDSTSYKRDETSKRVWTDIIKELLENQHIYNHLYIKKRKDYSKKKEFGIEEIFDIVDEIRKNLYTYHRTNLIIEEPEQNLFPTTQKELTYKLLEYINRDKDGHMITITTHSPYILYAINNCILAYLVKDKNKDSQLKNSMIKWKIEM